MSLTMEVSQEQNLDQKVTYVQIVTVTDMESAAAGAQVLQNMDQVMQLVPVPELPATTDVVESSSSQLMSTCTTTPTTTTTAKSSGSSTDERICLICGDRANGVHYNVLSCEGCKSFFLRSKRSGATFTCAHGGNCNMDLYTRRHCPACRMKRCLECGMKVERVWDPDRLQTRKPLVRRKRKKQQPKTTTSSPTTTSTPTPTPTPAPHSEVATTVALPPTALVSTSPCSTRSNSPKASAVTCPAPTLTPPGSVPSTWTGTSLTTNTAGAATTAISPPASVQLPPTPAPYPTLTPEQEELMQKLEKGYNASTEVLKHLSKDVPLFRKTYWSRIRKGSENCESAEHSSVEDGELEPKKSNLMIKSDTDTNSTQQVVATSNEMVATAVTDPLAALMSATGQDSEVIYRLTALATGGQITDPSSALNALASSGQGMAVISSIGSLVAGQNLDTLIGLAKLVGSIIGGMGGALNDTLADTIIGSITGSILNGAASGANAAMNAQLPQNIPTTSSNHDQNGNKSVSTAASEESAHNSVIAKIASSGLAEAMAMLAAMASSSQDKTTLVEMVKRAVMTLLNGKEDAQKMAMSSSSSFQFQMPADVRENEVKTSPFLQSLQRVTSFLTSGNMSAASKALTKGKRTIDKEMLHIAMDMFAVLVKQTIHFAKSIPGFTNLSCDDQAVLIKSSIVDALLLRCADSYALDKDCLVNDSNGDKFDVSMMYQLGFSTLPEVVFEFMRDTKACGLNTAEYALLTAAALLSPDRSDLKDRTLVEEMQLEMILALQAATKVFHTDKPLLFAKLITKLTTLRDMSILHLSEIMAVKVQEQDLSPLIVELFGLDS